MVSDDLLQDWVRLPASEVDVRCRLQRLWHEAVARPPRPVLEGDGRLSFGGAGSA